jgi:hypothetical protein
VVYMPVLFGQKGRTVSAAAALMLEKLGNIDSGIVAASCILASAAPILDRPLPVRMLFGPLGRAAPPNLRISFPVLSDLFLVGPGIFATARALCIQIARIEPMVVTPTTLDALPVSDKPLRDVPMLAGLAGKIPDHSSSPCRGH